MCKFCNSHFSEAKGNFLLARNKINALLESFSTLKMKKKERKEYKDTIE